MVYMNIFQRFKVKWVKNTEYVEFQAKYRILLRIYCSVLIKYWFLEGQIKRLKTATDVNS